MTDRKARPDGPTLYIDDIERRRIIELTKGRGARAALAVACDVRPSAITLLLRPFKPGEKRRGCRFLPKLQAHLHLANSSKTRPAVISADAMKRAETILKAFGDDRAALENWLGNGEFLTKKS